MGYLRYAKYAILIALVVFFLILIHPFTKAAIFVESVESPAAVSIRTGDLIYSVNGNPIKTMEEYENAVSEIKPNDTVTIVALRETFPYTYRNATNLFVADEMDDKTFLGIVAKETKLFKN